MLQPARQDSGASRVTEDRQLLRVAELADRLGTTERFVRRLVCERRTPFHKVVRYIRFAQQDVDDWLARSRVEAL